MKATEKIKHLHLRAGFGLRPEEWAKKRKEPLNQQIDAFFKQTKAQPFRALDFPFPKDPKSLSKKKRRELRKKSRKLRNQVNNQWIERMIRPKKESPLLDKMALFWHGHFACEPKLHHHAEEYLAAIRQHALGNFKDLLLAVSKSTAMILYLNNQQNRKKKPNENFARELMELFTLGRGHYKEQDIKESARAFTGWHCDPLQAQFQFKERQHDAGSKTFMGQTGHFGGEDIINIILQQKRCAEFLAEKLYAFFVNERKPNKKHISALADMIYNSHYDLQTALRFLFSADWFYDPKHLGANIKSPVLLLVQLARILDLRAENELAWLQPQQALGQLLFKPPNVAGWPGGRSWIDHSLLLMRLNLAAAIFEKTNIVFRPKDDPKAAGRGKGFRKLAVRANLAPLNKLCSQEKDILAALSDYLLLQAPKLSAPNFQAYLSLAQTKEEKIKAGSLLLLSTPEFQIC